MRTLSKCITFAVLVGVVAISAEGILEEQASAPDIAKSMEQARMDARALESSAAGKKSAMSLQQKTIHLAANNAVERKVNMTHTGNSAGYTNQSDNNLEKVKAASQETWEDTKEGTKEAVEKTKDASENAWDKTKEKNGDAWEATKEALTPNDTPNNH